MGSHPQVCTPHLIIITDSELYVIHKQILVAYIKFFLMYYMSIINYFSLSIATYNFGCHTGYNGMIVRGP